MKKATVTYTAPPGEAKTMELCGTVIVSGKAETITCDDYMMKKLQAASDGGGMFKVEGVSDAEHPKEPPKHDDKHKGKAA